MDEYEDNINATMLDLLPDIIRDKPTWKDMFDVFSRVMDTNVDGPIFQLERIRTVDKDSDVGILNSTARLLGFDLTQDVLNLSADNLTKVVSQLSLYPDQNGTILFTKFIDLILNALTEVQYLWTQDYVNFYPTPGGTLVADGGTWFKITHINLSMALLSLDTLVLSPGQSLYQRVKELFYTFAPVALVIERLDFVILFEDKEWLGGSAFGVGTYFGHTNARVIID